VLARNDFALRVEAGEPPSAILADLTLNSRDNARTPMQWDDSTHAGFTTGQALAGGQSQPLTGSTSRSSATTPIRCSTTTAA
jgi:hypothetical protein